MTEKELKKLGRQDLLILLGEQTERANKLESLLHKAEEKLNDRRLMQEESGTMAEAALKINNVFQAIDAAAEQYLENIRISQEKQKDRLEEIEALGRQKCDEMLQEAQKEIAEMQKVSEKQVEEARLEAEKIISNANDKAVQEEKRIGEMMSSAEEQLEAAKQQADEIVKTAQETAALEMRKVDEHWNEIYARIQSMEKEYSWLRGIFQRKNGVEQ